MTSWTWVDTTIAEWNLYQQASKKLDRTSKTSSEGIRKNCQVDPPYDGDLGAVLWSH